INKWMVIILILSLSCFVVFGLPKVDYTVFQPETMFPAGFTGFFTAIGLVGFATGGAQFVAELGGEMKNPRRDLPIVIIGSTVLIGFFYALIAAVAVGVLPIEQVAGQPLTAVANEVLPKPVFVIFIVGGAMFALATTLNATFTWV
ncbi:amino acid permease, partial [Gemella sp. 19428wG2_WT2a]